jgi:hypothetical protein
MVWAALFQQGSRDAGQMAWIVDVLLPALFTLLLLGCLIQLSYCAFKAQQHPMVRFQYAISAFAL